MKNARILCFILFLALMGLPAQADDGTRDRVIIVMDASGSMWGQIDKVPKITIARQVINELLNDWDEDIDLGLVAYGHRRKKDCTDIQVLVPVGANTQKAVLKARDAGSLKLALERTVTQIKTKPKAAPPTLGGTKLIALIKENGEEYKGDKSFNMDLGWKVLTPDDKQVNGQILINVKPGEEQAVTIDMKNT